MTASELGALVGLWTLAVLVLGTIFVIIAYGE